MAQFTAMDAVPATGRFDAEEIVDGAFATVRPQLVEMLEALCGPVTPAMLFHFELIVFTLLREFGRVLLEKLFNSLEGDGSELPHDEVRGVFRTVQLLISEGREKRPARPFKGLARTLSCDPGLVTV